MLVFDRLTVSHKAGVSIEPPVASEVPTGHVVTLPGDEPAEIAVSASQMDAYHILADLCLLTASTSTGLWGGSADKERDKPTILKLGSLQRTFGLELIESILSGYEESVKQVSPMLPHGRDILRGLMTSAQNSSTSSNTPSRPSCSSYKPKGRPFR
jgi:hypothetical protein